MVFDHYGSSYVSKGSPFLWRLFRILLLGKQMVFLQSNFKVNKFLPLTCNRMWIFSLPALEYLLLQPGTSQTKGFSPVWVNSWAYKWPLVMNFWLHSKQTNGRSPVWVLMCVLRLPVSANSLRHFSNGQIKTFFSSFGRFTFSNYWKFEGRRYYSLRPLLNVGEAARGGEVPRRQRDEAFSADDWTLFLPTGSGL